MDRPEGRLIWFHAASVGEALSLLEVIRRLGEHDPDLVFLVTTGTTTSAAILDARMPARCRHQYVPLDVRPWICKFLAHWRPDLAIWTESELWPALIVETDAAGVPMILINARLSERSIRRWRRLGGAAASILGRFAAAQVQDDRTAIALRRLGMPVERLFITGTLKEGTPPPPCDEPERQRLAKVLGGRPVWFAASTHAGEDRPVIAAHKAALASAHRLLLIVAPRHPERGASLATLWRAEGWRVARRGAGETPDAETQIYLADTLGEMGLWYRLAPLSFVGGSLADHGGHNPFEPAALGSAILHGPHTRNFADIYARLDRAGAARTVTDGPGLGAAVIDLLQPDNAAPMAFAAWELCSSGADVTDKAMALILEHLPGAPSAGATPAIAAPDA